jgi:hypothetical protein
MESQICYRKNTVYAVEKSRFVISDGDCMEILLEILRKYS